jgi:uncharacterized protein (DUF1697 family)
LSLKISVAITKKKYGWEVPVIVVESKQLLSIFENSPFTGEKKEQSYLTMLAEALLLKI